MTKVTETTRRFKITSNIVLNNLPEHTTEEQIQEALNNLFESTFAKADPDMLLEAGITNISEEAL